MTCGEQTTSTAERPLSPGKQRRLLELEQRNRNMLTFMKRRWSVQQIALETGLPVDRCRTICNQLAREHGLEYDPSQRGTAEDGPSLFSEDTKAIRRLMGYILYDLRNVDKLHPIEIARLTGVSQVQQKRAIVAPYEIDYTLSQLSRTAAAAKTELRELLLKALLGEANLKKVIACLNR